MRRTLYLLFAIGLVMKVLHLPYHTLFLLALVVGLLVNAIAGLVRHRSEPGSALVQLAIALWLLHTVALLKLFPFRTATLVLAALATGLALYIGMRTGDRIRTAVAPLLLVLVAVLVVQAVPTAARYQFTNLRFSLERATDAGSWDKYSFLLHREGHRTAALAASDSARAAAQRCGHPEWLPVLEQHRTSIERDAWDRYHPLPH